MQTTIEVKCFPGFYETIFSEIYIEESEIERLQMEFPDFQHLSEWEIDSDIYRMTVAKEFSTTYVDELNDKLQLCIKLVSEYIQNPREYNFYTNQIICTIEVDDYDVFIDKIIQLMDDPQYHARLEDIIRKRHSDAPGFWSFMSNRISEWYDQLRDPDNTNYLECVLWYLYCLKTDEPLDGSSDYGIAALVYEYIMCNTDVMDVIPMTDAARAEYEQWQQEEAKREMLRQLPVIPGLEC